MLMACQASVYSSHPARNSNERVPKVNTNRCSMSD